MGRADAKGPPEQWTRAMAVDRYLSNVETLVSAIEARELTTEQEDRFARILQRAEVNLLARVSTTYRARALRPARVDRSSS